jgi:hypothetical protein
MSSSKVKNRMFDQAWESKKYYWGPVHPVMHHSKIRHVVLNNMPDIKYRLKLIYEAFEMRMQLQNQTLSN